MPTKPADMPQHALDEILNRIARGSLTVPEAKQLLGLAEPPPCYVPAPGLKCATVAALNRISTQPTESELEMEQLRSRINRLANLPLEQQSTQNNITIAALRARLAVLDSEAKSLS